MNEKYSVLAEVSLYLLDSSGYNTIITLLHVLDFYVFLDEITDCIQFGLIS